MKNSPAITLAPSGGEISRFRYEPQSLTEAVKLSRSLAGTGLVPKALRGKPDDLLLVMMLGADLGLSSIQSLRSVHVINGRPTLSADLMVALCLASPLCEEFRPVFQSPTKAVWTARRKGCENSTSEWTIEDAQRAGLLRNPTWKSYPARMLSARAKAFLARDLFPDLVGGLYTPEEIQGIEPSGDVPSVIVDSPRTPPQPMRSITAESGGSMPGDSDGPQAAEVGEEEREGDTGIAESDSDLAKSQFSATCKAACEDIIEWSLKEIGSVEEAWARVLLPQLRAQFPGERYDCEMVVKGAERVLAFEAKQAEGSAINFIAEECGVHEKHALASLRKRYARTIENGDPADPKSVRLAMDSTIHKREKERKAREDREFEKSEREFNKALGALPDHNTNDETKDATEGGR